LPERAEDSLGEDSGRNAGRRQQGIGRQAHAPDEREPGEDQRAQIEQPALVAYPGDALGDLAIAEREAEQRHVGEPPGIVVASERRRLDAV
jgi:hypothetical protein